MIRSTGSWHDVQAMGRVLPCRVPGRFRLDEQDVTNPVAVGDRVTLRTEGDGTGVITTIHERHNKLSRRASGRRVGREQVIVANVDRVWIVQSVRFPKPNPGFIDRVLVMCEAFELPAGIVFNKIDLLRPKDRNEYAYLRDLYASLGYAVLETSAETGAGIDIFKDELKGMMSVVTGPSGVGKSTLLNVVEPDLDLRTGDVSAKTRKGKHTTTYAALYPLSDGGFVVDTPGIREFGVLDLEAWELSHYFVEFREFIEHCRFPTCTHDHEPDCAVKEAYLDDDISDERYYSYLNILHSIRMGESDVGR